MELMAYFGTLSAGARVMIAEELMAMVNWPPDRELKNGLGETIKYTEPSVRLERLMRALKSVTEWPGMAQIRAVYCKMYKPADGIEVSSCTIPGFTDEEIEAHADYFTLNRAPEPKYLPKPDDEPVGEDIKALIGSAAKKLTGAK